MTNKELEGCELHARHIWEQTSIVDANQPYARKDQTINPLAIVFANDDLHPTRGPRYLHESTSAKQARSLSSQRDSEVDRIYRQVKATLLSGNIERAKAISKSTPHQCICLCTSEREILDYFLHLHAVGATPGGLSDSDFFSFADYLAVTWTPDWSCVLDIYPDSEFQ